MNRIEIEIAKKVLDFTSSVESVEDQWDIGNRFEAYVEAEEMLKVNNADISGEAREFFNKTMKDAFELLKKKTYFIYHPKQETEVSEEEEGPF